jgi:DNA gyrase subunit A
MLRLQILEVPALPSTDDPPSLAGGAPLRELVALERGEEAVALVSLDGETPLALGTAQGVVKRVAPEAAPARDAWEVIGLKEGDRVVGAAPAGDSAQLVFVTTDAQLLHFPASAVRPQGPPAGGMAGINLGAGQAVVSFTALDTQADAVVVTISGSSDGLPGTQPGAAKTTPLSEYPAKGRATGGVRAHRFLKGEDTLLLAWVGPSPARASAGSGQPLELPAEFGRRDGSGQSLTAPVGGVG